MKYELKKMLGIKQFKYLIIISFTIPFIVTMYFIHNYEGYTIKNNEVEYVEGYEGIKNTINLEKKQQGYLDSEKIEKPLAYIKENYENEKVISLAEAKFPGYFSILSGAYVSNLYANNGIMNARPNTFYTNVDNRCMERFNQYSRSRIQGYIDRIQKPFYKGVTSTWVLSFKIMYVSIICVMIFTVLLNSMMFSIEKEMEMEYMYKNIEGGKLKMIKKNKLLTSMGIVSIIFIMSVIASILPLIVTGFDGFRSSLQVLPMMVTSLYPWSVGESFLIYILICYTNVLLVMMVTQCIDYLLKNKLSTILIMLSILFIIFQFKSYFLTDNTENWIMYIPVISVDFLRYMRMLPSLIGNIPILVIVNILILFVVEFIYFGIDFLKLKTKNT